MTESWTGERAERHLRSLELFGMRFGLDRMRRMMTVLGSPHRRFPVVHVVGTNGKTSTTRMCAAILERHGLRTGTYLSPHLRSYAERVQVAERDLSSSAFAAAVARAAWAAERVNRTLADDDHVTQFELLTAAAFWVLAEREVDVAVVEAGLGGRFDATAVVESGVTVLTSVGLEHTRWLGPTVRDIATEKLAVLRPDTVLALGADLHPEALAVARTLAAERRARIVQTSAAGFFQQRNFALARVAAEAHLASAGIPVRETAIREAERAVDVPGRLQPVADDPLTVLDGAHNPDAARALVEALPEVLADRLAETGMLVDSGMLAETGTDQGDTRSARIPGSASAEGACHPASVKRVSPESVGGECLPASVARSMGSPPGAGGLQYQLAHGWGGPPTPHNQLAHGRGGPPRVGGFPSQLALVMGVLEDKDAASMLAALLPLCARAWFTAPPSPRALSPAALQSLARQQGFERAVCEPHPRRALALAREWARAEGSTAVLATGSIYLVGDLLAHLSESAGAQDVRGRA